MIIVLTSIVTGIVNYFAIRFFVTKFNEPRPGETDEEYFARQTDPTYAGVVAGLLGIFGVVPLCWSMYRGARGLVPAAVFGVFSTAVGMGVGLTLAVATAIFSHFVHGA